MTVTPTKETHVSDQSMIPPLDRLDVDVIAEPKGSGGVRWSQQIKDPGHNNGGKVKLPRGRGYKIKFGLKDHTNLNIRFDASAPFFVREGSVGPCPSGMNSSQVMVDECDADALVVTDWNYGAECELHYQLNFVDTTGKPINSYDPIIENGGGGVPPW